MYKWHGATLAKVKQCSVENCTNDVLKAKGDCVNGMEQTAKSNYAVFLTAEIKRRSVLCAEAFSILTAASQPADRPAIKQLEKSADAFVKTSISEECRSGNHLQDCRHFF